MAAASRTATRKPEASRPARGVAPTLHRSPAAGQATSTARLLQSRLGNAGTAALLARGANGGMLRRASGLAENAGSEAPAIVRDVLRSTGQPLDQATRAYFEPRFGHDFSTVRVHTDLR